MSQTNYKSTRLLIEAVDHEMKVVRKAAMGNMEVGALNALRDLIDQLAKKADRLAVEDLQDQRPVDYVATMKPLVASYHLQLAVADRLASCLCDDLKVNACVVILVGDGKSLVKTAMVSDRPDVALTVEAILASIDAGTKRIAAEVEASTGVSLDDIDRQAGDPVSYKSAPLTLENLESATRTALGLESPDSEQQMVPAPDLLTDWKRYVFRNGPCEGSHDDPCGASDCYVLERIREQWRTRLLEEAERIGWDSPEGERLRARAKADKEA